MKRTNPKYNTLQNDTLSTVMAMVLIAYFGGYIIWEVIMK